MSLNVRQEIVSTGNNSCTWDVPRPDSRLWLTVAMGVLGTLLFSVKAEFFINPFAADKFFKKIVTKTFGIGLFC
jgi:hypothetical protein